MVMACIAQLVEISINFKIGIVYDNSWTAE